MSMSLPYLAANVLWLAGGIKATRAFRASLREPRRIQEALLLELLRRNAGSEYGRRYDFGRLRSPREYQDAVPIVTYDDLEEEIEAIKRGRPRVLTEEPVLMLEKTAGSTGASKYIPYTAGLKREFQAAIAPWVADLYGRRPRMLRGGAYWSVSPLAAEREVTEGGLPVGFDEDVEYFGRLEQWVLARLMRTPRALPRVLEIDASRYVTLRFLLQTPRLSFISVWNPSFLTLLVHALQEHADRLVADIRRGILTPPAPLLPDPQADAALHALLARPLRPRPARALQLEELLRHHGTLPPEEVWPHLSVISCWTEASAARFVPELRALFPHVEIQPKGLLATEGVVSIPLTGHPGAALAVTSHFLEFVEEEAPRLADELELGRTYTVLLTTGGGLYRYALGDRVRVVGRVENTPLVEFLGKGDPVCDLCGEKLHEERVGAVLDAVFREFAVEPAFAMIAPEWEGAPPAYVLFMETPELTAARFDELVRRVEARLAEGYHYAYCRRLGQLGPLRGFRVRRGGSRTYLERCAALGQRRGSIKPTALHREPGWSAWFEQTAHSTQRTAHRVQPDKGVG
jgi:hypothetical protein